MVRERSDTVPSGTEGASPVMTGALARLDGEAGVAACVARPRTRTHRGGARALGSDPTRAEERPKPGREARQTGIRSQACLNASARPGSLSCRIIRSCLTGTISTSPVAARPERGLPAGDEGPAHPLPSFCRPGTGGCVRGRPALAPRPDPPQPPSRAELAPVRLACLANEDRGRDLIARPITRLAGDATPARGSGRDAPLAGCRRGRRSPRAWVG